MVYWCRHPCRRYTYPGAYDPHPALSQDFDTGGVIRIRHQRFSSIYTGLIRYLPPLTEHLRIFAPQCPITCSALIALTKTCDCVAFKRLASNPRRSSSSSEANHLSGRHPPPLSRLVPRARRKAHINSLSCPRHKRYLPPAHRRRECVSPLCAGHARCRLAGDRVEPSQYLSIFFQPRWKEKVRGKPEKLLTGISHIGRDTGAVLGAPGADLLRQRDQFVPRA